MSKETAPSVHKCVTCGETLIGKFCHKCGEKKLSRDDFTVKQFLKQGIDVFTHLDSKAFRSATLLFDDPGKLTRNYLDGKRNIYAKPIQLFFLINILYFLVLNYIGFDIITNPLEDYMSNFIYGPLVTSLVNKKLIAKNISLEQYSVKFYDAIYLHSKVLIILMIPLFALCLKLIYIKKDKLLYEHLIYATYFFCFALLFYTVIINIIYYTLYYFTVLNNNVHSVIELNDYAVIIIVIISFSIYSYYALRRIHGHPVKEGIMYAALSMIALSFVVFFYDLLIFFVVYFTT